MENNKIKAYKVFNSDWKCRDFQYDVGKTYSLTDKEGKLISPVLCESGFHACIKVNNCFNYYNFNPDNKIAEVELFGVILGIDADKQCSNNITIVKEITWTEMLNLANTGLGCSGHSNSGRNNSGNWNSGHSNSGDRNSGHSNLGDRNSGHNNSGNWNSGRNNSGNWNSGHRNSGNLNSGDRNSGHRNSGNLNSGDWNSGDWNSGDRQNGFFNTVSPKTINIFNKDCDIEIWRKVNKPHFIYNIILNKWVSFNNMTEEEKIKYPKAFVCNGYLETFSYKEAWKNAYDIRESDDIELLKALPNFDAKIFEKITGIKID